MSPDRVSVVFKQGERDNDDRKGRNSWGEKQRKRNLFRRVMTGRRVEV